MAARLHGWIVGLSKGGERGEKGGSGRGRLIDCLLACGSKALGRPTRRPLSLWGWRAATSPTTRRSTPNPKNAGKRQACTAAPQQQGGATQNYAYAPVADLVHKDGEEEDEHVRHDEEAEVGAAAHDARDEAEDPVDGEEVVDLDRHHLALEGDGPDLARRLPGERAGVLYSRRRGAAARVAHGFWLPVCCCGLCWLGHEGKGSRLMTTTAIHEPTAPSDRPIFERPGQRRAAGGWSSDRGLACAAVPSPRSCACVCARRGALLPLATSDHRASPKIGCARERAVVRLFFVPSAAAWIPWLLLALQAGAGLTRKGRASRPETRSVRLEKEKSGTCPAHYRLLYVSSWRDATGCDVDDMGRARTRASASLCRLFLASIHAL